MKANGSVTMVEVEAIMRDVFSSGITRRQEVLTFFNAGSHWQITFCWLRPIIVFSPRAG
jgi:hypothetical protein